MFVQTSQWHISQTESPDRAAFLILQNKYGMDDIIVPISVYRMESELCREKSADVFITLRQPFSWRGITVEELLSYYTGKDFILEASKKGH